MENEEAFRVVLRGCPFNSDVEKLKREINALGYSVWSITNMKTRSNRPLNLFYVDLDPNYHNELLYSVKRLGKVEVSFEPPRVKPELVQCSGCHVHGHTVANCKKKQTSSISYINNGQLVRYNPSVNSARSGLINSMDEIKNVFQECVQQLEYLSLKLNASQLSNSLRH